VKKVKVVSPNNLRARAPLASTILSYLLLERFEAQGWVWGVVGTLFAIVWIAWASRVWNEEHVDVFKDDGGLRR